jgi:ribosomal protein S21
MEYKPSNMLWGTIKVRADENVKEAAEALKWDFNKTGIQVRWKPHQSADSGTQVQIVCCPDLFDKEVHLNEVKESRTLGQERSTTDKEKNHMAGRRYFKGLHSDDTRYTDHQKTI